MVLRGCAGCALEPRPFSLPASEFFTGDSPNASLCTKSALKLLNWRSLPGGVPGLGEAVSEAVSPVATAGEGRVC